MALRRKSTPISADSAELSPCKRPKRSVNESTTDATETSTMSTASSGPRELSPPARQLVALPIIPTGCTPPRKDVPGNSQSPRSPILQVHATLRSESDVELLGSPSPATTSTRGDLAQRVKDLEKKLLQMAETRHSSPVRPRRQVSFQETPKRGRSELRPLPRRWATVPDSPEARRSVFDRLGDREEQGHRRSPSPTPDRSPDRDMDVNWTTLLDLGLTLAGRQRSPSPEASGADGLLASRPGTSRSKPTFPPSKGVLDSLQKAFQKFTGPEDIQGCRPENLPSEATSQVSGNKFVRSFNPRFHGANTFPLSLQSSKPSAEETSYLRKQADPAVPIARVADVELLLRKNIRVMSTLDWLLNTLKEVSRLPHQDGHVLDALWMNIHKTLAFATDFTSSAFMCALISRREAFLRACDPMKVPRRTHTWAALRSPMTTSRPSLLGDTGDAFRVASREDRELAIVNSLSSNRQQNQRSSRQYNNNNNNNSSNNRLQSTVSRPQASGGNSSRRGGYNSSAGTNTTGNSYKTRGRPNSGRRH